MRWQKRLQQLRTIVVSTPVLNCGNITLFTEDNENRILLLFEYRSSFSSVLVKLAGCVMRNLIAICLKKIK